MASPIMQLSSIFCQRWLSVTLEGCLSYLFGQIRTLSSHSLGLRFTGSAPHVKTLRVFGLTIINDHRWRQIRHIKSWHTWPRLVIQSQTDENSTITCWTRSGSTKSSAASATLMSACNVNLRSKMSSAAGKGEI